MLDEGESVSMEDREWPLSWAWEDVNKAEERKE